MHKLLIGLVGLVALLVVALLALPSLTNLTTVRDRMAATASEALQHPVTITRLSLRAIPSPALQIEGLGITERNGAPVVMVDTLWVEVKLVPLLQQEVVMDRIIIVRPRLTLARNPDGSLNLPLPALAPPSTTAPEGSSQPLHLFLDDVRIEDGTLTIRERQSPDAPPLLHLQKITVTATDLSAHGNTPDDFTRSLTGTARLEVTDGSLGTLTTLAQILSLLNLPHKDILIDRLAGTLQFKNGLMTTSDLTLNSSLLNADITGTFNLPNKQMKMVVTAMGLTFDIQGSAANPSVSSRALKGLQEELGGLLEKGLDLLRRR